MRTKNIRVAAAAIAGFGLLAAAQPSLGEELRIGTASQGGAFYPVGQAISTLVTKHAKGLTMVPVVTQGSVQNPRLVNKGEVDVGITNNNLALFANKGLAMYKKGGKMELRAIGSLHFSVLHMMTLKGSSISKFSDIKGKRVAVGPAGGGTLAFMRRLLSLYGMTMKDITPSFLSYGDGFSQLADGNVDAAFALSGYPSGAVMRARASKELKYIVLPADKMKEALAKYRFYTRVEIPKDVYRTSSAGVALGVNNMLVVKKSMNADKVYAITKAIYDHMDEFRANNAHAKQIVPENSLKLTIPLHDGAARYFKK